MRSSQKTKEAAAVTGAGAPLGATAAGSTTTASGSKRGGAKIIRSRDVFDPHSSPLAGGGGGRSSSKAIGSPHKPGTAGGSGRAPAPLGGGSMKRALGKSLDNSHVNAEAKRDEMAQKKKVNILTHSHSLSRSSSY